MVESRETAMKQRLFWATSVMTLSAALVMGRASERATLILVDGERVSGTVVFHTPDAVNLFRGDFNIGLADGKEVSIHQDQVAVIEFLAGTPDTSELAAVPNTGQLMAMRNGDVKRGSFVNMLRGDTVRWKPENGNEQEYPIRDVRRIYLQADAARSLYNYRPSAAAPIPAQPVGSASTPQAGVGTIGLTLYAEPNFSGANTNFRRNVSDLRQYNFNDKAWSLQVGKGEMWEVCEDAGFKGRCQVFSANESDLGHIKWSGIISSARRLSGPKH